MTAGWLRPAGWLLASWIMIGLTGCSHTEERPLVVTTLAPIGQMDQKFGFINHLAYDDGLTYLALRDEHHIQVLDQGGDPVRLIGAPGAGPGEFQGLQTIQAAHGFVFAVDQTNRVSVFEPDGELVAEFHLSFIPSPVFAVDPNMVIWFNNPLGADLVEGYDLHGIRQRGFGIPEKLRSRIHTRSSNEGMVFYDEALGFIFAHAYQPIVKVYDKAGTLQQEVDFSNDPGIKSRLGYIREYFAESPDKKKNTSLAIFEDGNLYDGTLYLLYWDASRRARRILEVDMTRHEDRVVRNILLTHAGGVREFMGGKFCASPEGFQAYDASLDLLFLFPFP